MGFSKAHCFNPSDYHYSLLLKALNHPARLAIIRKLHLEGACTVKKLSQGMCLSKPSMSQHLQILREMHILKCEQQTPTVIYWLNTDLPNTYNTVIDLLLRAGQTFDTSHLSEIAAISRFMRASAEQV